MISDRTFVILKKIFDNGVFKEIINNKTMIENVVNIKECLSIIMKYNGLNITKESIQKENFIENILTETNIPGFSTTQTRIYILTSIFKPRIDRSVTLNKTHMIKLPLTPHYLNGNISVLMDKNTALNFYQYMEHGGEPNVMDIKDTTGLIKKSENLMKYSIK